MSQEWKILFTKIRNDDLTRSYVKGQFHPPQPYKLNGPVPPEVRAQIDDWVQIVLNGQTFSRTSTHWSMNEGEFTYQLVIKGSADQDYAKFVSELASY